MTAEKGTERMANDERIIELLERLVAIQEEAAARTKELDAKYLPIRDEENEYILSRRPIAEELEATVLKAQQLNARLAEEQLREKEEYRAEREEWKKKSA